MRISNGIQTETLFSDDIQKWWTYYQKLPEKMLSAYHRPDYFLFQERVGQGKAFLQIFSSGDRFIYYPGLLRTLPHGENGYDIDSGWYYGGPIANFATGKSLESFWLTEINNIRNKQGIVTEFIRFDPNVENHILLENLFDIDFNRETVVVDLDCEWERVWKNFSSQNRRNVKKAVRNDLVAEKSTSETSWETFERIYDEEMKRKNAPMHLRFNSLFFRELRQLSNMDFFVVRKADEIIGGFIAASNKDIAHHFLSATKHNHFETRPNNLLFTEVLRHYHKAGLKMFDFQGGREGVFRFKGNFSDKRNNFYIGKKIFNQKIYNKLSGNTETTFFPAYRSVCHG